MSKKSVLKKYDESYNKDLKIELYYSKGGMNYFSGNTERRGFYLSVSPVERTNHGNGIVSESYMAFSGTKKLILETSRYSKKSEQESEKLVEDEIPTLVDYVVKQNQLSKKEKQNDTEPSQHS